MNALLTYAAVLLFSCTLYGQNPGAFSLNPRFSRNAILNVGYSTSTTSSGENTRDANVFMAAFRGNVSAWGMQIPVNFSYRSGQLSSGLTNPFVRLGISPSYKWLKLHLGHRTMHFSRYSLSDLSFLGAGVELNPGIFRFAAMYGDIQNPNYNLDTLALYANLVFDYKRKAHGVKIGLGKQDNFIDFFYVKVKDNYSIRDIEKIYIERMPPPENLVTGTQMKWTLFKKLSFSAGANLSIMTNNQLSRNDFNPEGISRQLREAADNFMLTNNTTKANLAGEAAVRYADRNFNIGLQYNRVDPAYRSLGIHYVLDDVENYTVTAGFRALKNKVNLNGRYGWQRNNLGNIRRNTTERIIYSINANLMFSSSTGINVNYSNFATDQRAGFAVINDTFRLVQNTSITAINPYIQWGKDSKHMISIAYNNNKLVDVSPLDITGRNANNTAWLLNHRYDNRKSGIGTSLSLQYLKNDFNETQSERMGTNLSFRKKWTKPDLTFNVSGGFHLLSQDGQKDGNVWNAGISGNIRISDRSDLQMSATYLNKDTRLSRSFNELRIAVHANYVILKNKDHEKK